MVDGVDGMPGTAGTPGDDGTSCTIEPNADGSSTIRCTDGTNVIVRDGVPGRDATAGLGLNVDFVASSPAAGGFFAAGERIVLTITLTDDDGEPLLLEDLGGASLYMYGPQDVLTVESASALLNATNDRTVTDRQHHYINLATTTNANLVVADNVLTYTLEPITTELPGTYTASFRAQRADDPLVQVFPMVDVQIGTADVEPQIIDGCANCHEASNGRLYMHHIDQGSRGQGNPAIDSAPPGTCLSCHNNEGYASIANCSDGTAAPCTAPATEVRISDHIVLRAHGVHNGTNLSNVANVGAGGHYEDYEELVFPADIMNCTACHADDSWATRPSRLACGACHDNVDFAANVISPPRTSSRLAGISEGHCADVGGVRAACPTNYTCNLTTNNCERRTHGGGAQTNDSGCATSCHTGVAGTGLSSVPDRHDPTPAASTLTAVAVLSPPGGGRTYYTDETPTLTLSVNNAAGTPVDPRTWVSTYSNARLFVNGPRQNTQPVLTTIASTDLGGGSAPSAPGTTLGSYRYVDLRLTSTGGERDVAVIRSATAISYQLGSVAGLEPGTYRVVMTHRPASPGPYAMVMTEFQVGTATVDPVIAGNCGDCHADSTMHGFPISAGPDLCKSCHDYEVQRSGRTAWTDSNWGFGAGPFSRRVHGVHFGHYLENPDELHSPWDDGEAPGRFIFPHDVRSCETCHSTSDSWAQEPARLPCMGCHDSSSAQAHGRLMTIDPTPAEPFSGDEIESCATCHGPGRDYSVENVHNINDPYVPPYFR